jgi:hypothetical protein
MIQCSVIHLAIVLSHFSELSHFYFYSAQPFLVLQCFLVATLLSHFSLFTAQSFSSFATVLSHSSFVTVLSHSSLLQRVGRTIIL